MDELGLDGAPAIVRKVNGSRYHKDWLRAFIEYSSYGEAPIATLMWTGVSTIAGALRRQVYIDMKYFQWLANFYVILVAPPGIISKSTTANIGMNLLREIEGIRFGPDVVTWQALVTAFAGAAEEIPNPHTGEFFSMSCLTIASDELGNFFNPQDREMVDMLVTLWDGKHGDFKKLTKGGGEEQVVNPWINFIGCTTPAWIAGNFPEYLIGGGFTSRCVFVYADAKRQEVAYPDEVIPETFLDLRRTLIHDLEAISTLFGEVGLSKAAREWGRDWYSHHWRNPPAGLSQEQFGGYLARKQTHIHKLAMILCAAQGNDLTISADQLRAAAEIVSSLEPTLNRVFSRIGQSDLTRHSGTLVDIVHKATVIPYLELFRRMFRLVSADEFALAVKSAVQAGHITVKTEGGTMIVYAVGSGI